MSGTSGDGVDASLINSDGDSNYNVEINKYFEYENNFSQKIHLLKDKITIATLFKNGEKFTKKKKIAIIPKKTNNLFFNLT